MSCQRGMTCKERPKGKMTYIDLLREARPWLRMQKPIRVCNLYCHQRYPFEFAMMQQHLLTASGLIFESGPASFIHSFVLGISMTPSTLTCETCIPFGPNSLARLCERDLKANLPVEKDEQRAEPFMAAVAPVKIRVGGYCRSVELRSRGRTAWEKRKAPRLQRKFVSARIPKRPVSIVHTHFPPTHSRTPLDSAPGKVS